ncbi:MAG TPA: hypothetical protein VGF76_13395 [Polyangiaceae bacterium]
MSEKSAARYAPPISLERYTLQAIDPEFLRDQLEALLSSPVVANSGHSWRGTGLKGEDAQAESDTATDESDHATVADVRLLRDAFLAAAKST